MSHIIFNVFCVVLVLLVSYLLGCFNGSVVISHFIIKDDVRSHGSGNAGLTNFYRTFGGPLTFVVILTDVLKAVVAVWAGILAAKYLVADELLVVALGKYWAGAFCLLGHMFPCMFQFKGGKGILCGGTLAWMLGWKVGLVAWGLFAALWLLSKYVSLGSIFAGISLTVSVFLFYGHNWLYTALAFVISVLVVWCHRENIDRLLHGTERKFQWHSGPPKE